MTEITEAWKQYEGQIVNQEFPLEQYLGGSAQSAVFATQREKRTPQKAAIKLIPVHPGNAEGQLSRWKHAAALSDLHLIKLFQYGRCRLNGTEYLYVVMEYAEENLSQVLPQRPLTRQEARDMLGPTLDALAYLHVQGFAHTRLKPANILAVSDQLKISTDSIHQIGEPSRTPEVADPYAPPESGRGWIAPSIDIWSLGITLLETLTRHRPVWNETEDWEPLVPQTIPAPFLEIARGCLRRDPERRWTLDEVAGALQHTLSRGATATGAPVEKPTEKPAEKRAEKKETPAPAVSVSNAPAKPQSAHPQRRASLRWGYVVLLLGGLALAAWIGPRLMNHRATQPAPSLAPEQVSSAPQEPAATAPEAAQPTPTAPDVTENGQVPPQAVAPAVQPRPATPQLEANTAPSAVVKPLQTALKGEVLDQVLPDVPQSARDTIQGTIRVSVAVHVDAAGEVTEAELSSAGPSKYFAALALKAAQQWKFNPTEVDGRSVASTWILRFEFARDATRVIPAEQPR